jgi:hypothetical protein
MPRGGKRPGAGRPTNDALEEAAEKAAAKIVEGLADADPHTALRRLLAWHDKEFAACAAKLPTANPTNRFLIVKQMQEHSVAIRLTAEQLSKFAPPQEDAPRSVIRAPELCTTTEEWLEKYGPAKPGNESRGPAASPEIERLHQFADAASEPPPKPKLVWDADQPPAREQSTECWGGPQEFGPLRPAQIADLKRRRRL